MLITLLGKTKDDVHFSEISKLQNGNADSRRRLAQYCLKVSGGRGARAWKIGCSNYIFKDATLPLEIMEKLTMVSNYTQTSRVTGVPIRHLLTSGQRLKVAAQLQSYATDQGFIIPMIENQGELRVLQFEGTSLLS